ncbi:MAG: hypothetical protein RMJ55_18540, partial [Roseiflexaceae bacterium]|nr:hypothetical protein [Roseiflexaceae bacterium]
GLWQGRLFGTLCAVTVIFLLAALAARLYDQRVAAATIVAALVLTAHPTIHPLLLGRRVLAEIPMLAYLLVGYLFLWHALTGRWIALFPTALFLALAWVSKAQTSPFLLISLLVPALIASLARRWRIAAIFVVVTAGTVLGARMLPQWVYPALVDAQLPPDPTTGLIETVAIVTTPARRLDALQHLVIFGLPALCGLLWGTWRLWQDRAAANKGASAWYVRLTLIGLCGSWLAWYLTLSIGWARYMGPAIIVASIFMASLLADATGGFAIRCSLRSLTDLLTSRRRTRAGVAALFVVLLVVWGGTLTAMSIAATYPVRDHSALRVAQWLNAQPAGTRIETYESELHFLLDQPYTFPPDQVHVALLRRLWEIDNDAIIAYDPLVNNPDFLVEGGTGVAGLYAPTLASGQFKLVLEDGPYRVFKRVR